MGRLALDAIKQREICAIIAVGGSRRTAAKYVGCAPSTIQRTIANDEDFAKRVARAEADLEIIQLSNIGQAGKKSWNASAWLLERVYPERFGKRSPATIPIQQIDDVLTRLAAVIRKEVPEPERVKRLVKQIQRMLGKLYDDALRKSTKHAKR